VIKLKLHARRIAASYLRAAVATVGAVQLLDIGDLRGIPGALAGAALATIPAVLRAVEALAADLEG
jgi:hypothetical protein